MATKIVPATLTVTVSEGITLNGVPRGSTNTVEIATIGEVKNYIVSVTSGVAGTMVTEFGSSATKGGTMASPKYLRVTNLDDTNYVWLRIHGVDKTSIFKLEAGMSFVLGTLSIDASSSDIALSAANPEAGGEISAIADTAPVDVEVYQAGT